MTRYYLVHILTIFLVLQVSCQNPEETVIQDNSASEHTLGPNGMSGSTSQDPTSLKRSQMEESTGSLEGFIRDIDGNPVGQASLHIDGSYLGAATASDGSYVLHRIPPGSHRLVVTAPGYRLELSVEILPDSTTEFNIVL
ncbi:MAG: carboxypeptidase regulatory-like domain-containing protein [Rhodothermaceae bacterium]|nr:carboxypeptidase regulatory-like domain-containing protein [Rhodothermaceae bacterium]MXZ17481.1 carboxypeptidase regulatory-like domain-containing protein [Rhodothermaceae bacterium]MYC03241.1 carboxypeptidase regulatory-like domain-containing protein [Rhodothermaceae bacterium]MYG69807.1 carboxypeptidase regulatory-like domain-containing protein [Rhodothermaceae bacterium]MYI16144.1 carboxypeptidase regulatory-like domain-containing protein [Rhodothermaceae bacterium]